MMSSLSCTVIIVLQSCDIIDLQSMVYRIDKLASPGVGQLYESELN